MITRILLRSFIAYVLSLAFLGAQVAHANSIQIGLELEYSSFGDSSVTTDFYLNDNRIDDNRIDEILNGVGAALIIDEGDTLKVDISGLGISGVSIPGESTGFLNIFGLPIGTGASNLVNRLTSAVNTTGVDAYALMQLVYDYETAVNLGLVSDTIVGNQRIENNVVIDPGRIGGLEELTDEQDYLLEDDDAGFTIQMAWDFAAISSAASVDIVYELSVLPATVPVPAAAWLFCSGLIGLVGISRRKRASQQK